MASRSQVASEIRAEPGITSDAKASGIANWLNAQIVGLLRRSERWSTLAARSLLAVVLLTFGSQELYRPLFWTMYVPFLSPRSPVAEAAVLAHGAVIFVAGAALAFKVAPRFWALLSAIAMVAVLLALLPQGYNDIFARDLGVLGLCLAVMGTGQSGHPQPDEIPGRQ